MRHVVMFSGGVGSWAAARRVAERHRPESLILLFADTLMEDEDLYRFLEEAAANIGVPVTRIAEGRDPWQVFFDKRMIGNTRADPCSDILKRKFCRKWLEQNCKPEDTTCYVGIDWTEYHRYERAQGYWAPWRVEAPMCEAPYLTKDDMLAELQAAGIKPPRLYEMGFPHNNCGGFCIKAGVAHFAHLLKMMPERYAYHEGKEQEFRAYVGKDVSILRDRSGGQFKPLTLKELRERLEAAPEQLDLFDWGGCGCFSSEEGVA